MNYFLMTFDRVHSKRGEVTSETPEPDSHSGSRQRDYSCTARRTDLRHDGEVGESADRIKHACQSPRAEAAVCASVSCKHLDGHDPRSQKKNKGGTLM